MQKSVTLLDDRFSCHSHNEYNGWLVPWEIESFSKDRQNGQDGGWFDLSFWETIEIEGKDAKDFLQRMSTTDFRQPLNDNIAHGAFLTGKANPVALGMFTERSSQCFQFIVPPGQATTVQSHLETFHFAEELTITEKTNQFAYFGLWTPHKSTLSNIDFPRSPAMHRKPIEIPNAQVLGWSEDVRPALTWIQCERDSLGAFLEWLSKTQLKQLGHRLFELFRIQAAIPKIPTELGEKNIFLEGNFERAISRDKGCYPGQEVVERIFTYGNVNRKLMPVEIHLTGAELPPVPSPLRVEEEQVGTLICREKEPQKPSTACGLAYISKKYLKYKGSFRGDLDVEIRLQ